ncbi:GNAT family N-acetyltransferase [Pendulispora brunnea]|uniref:GNAT family N-acetyltransferase n=1 Tax=Pendulispora brunnea TaxID=2905690 RepID=A0ABZ2K7Q8_9BACT
MSHSVTLTLTDVADEKARTLINDRLDRYNDARTGISDVTPLDVHIVDEATGEVIGGLVGRTSLGVFFVDYFFVPESLRRKGHGKRALAMAEAEAVRRGCAKAVLFTMMIHAPAFYENAGYEVFGRIESNPPGNARLFMKKDLANR